MKDREKKRLYHKFLDGKTPANWQIYKNANRETKKGGAVTRANHYINLYDKLDTQDGERDLYRLAKSRNERTQDIEHFCCVNDKNGSCLPTVEQQRIGGENTSGRFQLKNLLILHFHNHCRHLEQFHMVLRGGGEEDGAATLLAKPKPSGRGELP